MTRPETWDGVATAIRYTSTMPVRMVRHNPAATPNARCGSAARYTPDTPMNQSPSPHTSSADTTRPRRSHSMVRPITPVTGRLRP